MTLSICALLLFALTQSQPASQDPVAAARALAQAKQWTELDARIASVGADDPAWERLASIVYSAAIARNDLPAVITRLRTVAEATTKPAIRAAALIAIGRANRRQGDREAAVRALGEAKASAPDSNYAEEAAGLIYEIEHLSPGLPAPPIEATSRSGKTVRLAALRGKSVVLVFWGST
jgi:hypothetical protein